MKLFLLIILFSLNIVASDKLEIKQSTKNSMLNALYANETLHESFFNYDAVKIDKSAKKVIKLLKRIENQKIKSDIEKAIKCLYKIQKDSLRKENNKNYHLASIFLLRVVNKYDLGERYQGHYCPMVRKKWLQNIERNPKVHNPYDSSMPNCGGRL